MSKIHLGRGLTFDARKLATEVTALYGMRGSGKSNTAAVIVEGCLAAKVQVIILDYVGIWPSLRLEADGKTPSQFQIPVIGGRLGDITLAPAAGRLLAESLVASGSSAVIDVSDFSKSDRCRFAADFGESLFVHKKSNPGPTLLVLEEAQRYIPQMIRHGMEYIARSAGAFEEIAEVGRNYGLGLMLITQRPQKVNVEVRNLAENAFAFRMLGVHEREAVQKYVHEKGIEGREDVRGELPSLPEGTALVWSPVRGIYGKFALAKKATYDAGQTPLYARKAVKIKPLDLGALESSMAKIVEDGKANDPKALKAKIADLEKQIKKASASVPAAKPGKTKTVEVKVVPQKIVDFVNGLPAQLDKILDAAKLFDSNVAALMKDGLKLGKAVAKLSAVPDELPHAGRVHSYPPMPGKAAHEILDVGRQPPPKPGNGHDTGKKIGSGERAILIACAQHGSDGCTRQQLTVLTGYKRSTRDAYIQRLYAKGCIVIEHDRVQATGTGVEVLGDSYEPLPTGAALLAHHLQRLPDGERKILEIAAAKWPGEADREMLTEHTGYKRSTRDAYIQRLAARQLVSADHGPVRASDTLFD